MIVVHTLLSAPKNADVLTFGDYINHISQFNCDNDGSKTNRVAPSGSKAWPGDKALLNAYGVLFVDVFRGLAKIFKRPNLLSDPKIEKIKPGTHTIRANKTLFFKKSRSLLPVAINSYDVKTKKPDILNNRYFVETIASSSPKKSKTVICPYCSKEKKCDVTYKVTRLVDFEELHINTYTKHLINKHCDFGYPGPYRITPEVICDFLDLGETDLSEAHDLYKVAKYNHLRFGDDLCNFLAEKENYHICDLRF